MNKPSASLRNHPTLKPSLPAWQQPTSPHPTIAPRPGYQQPVTRFWPSAPTQSPPGTRAGTPGQPPLPGTRGQAPNLLLPLSPPKPAPSSTRKRLTRIFTLCLLVALAAIIYSIWNNAPTTSAVSGGIAVPNNVTLAPSAGNTATSFTSTSDGGTITVYITGAVKHPGVYTLPAGARVYQLVQAAGGTLANADLAALNMATKLSDGQEVYVLQIGETPPYTGGSDITPVSGTAGPTGATGTLVNINTASADEMRQALHISSTTAEKIIAYRTEHGPYTSVDQLLQVVSRSIYDKIKGLVTVS
jgi:competence protein ComEA